MTMKDNFHVTRALSLALFATASSAAWAQGAPNAAEEEARSGGIAEIVVTAQKREENLQDTPISIVALGSDQLEQKGVSSLNDLFTGAIPSLRISPFLGRASAVSIGMRGLVPVDATQVTRDPTVGIYIDSVYVGRVSGLGMELSDIERIEVLRGPQGTLFGRNTIGGAVSVVTKKPTGEFGVDVKGGIGNYDFRSVAAHINLPRIAGVAIKFDGLYQDRGGLVLNPDPNLLDHAAIRKFGFKATALWEPADNVSILYSYDVSHDKSTSGYADITDTVQPAANIPAFLKLNEGRVRTARIGLPAYRNPQRARGHSLVAEWDVTDNMTIRSITAWRDLKSIQRDQDNGSLSVWGPNRLFGRLSYARVDQNQFSQEIQFVGDAGDFKYVFGGYYFNENGADEATAYFTARLNAANNGIVLLPEPVVNHASGRTPDRSARANVKSKALFGQVTWSPSALLGLHVTAGARYTDDHKDGLLTAINGVDPNKNFTFDSSRVDPMATIAYDFSNDINAYVKVSRAYRAGGANTRSFNMTKFGEEELVAWEAGLKADLFDRHVRLNLAAYTSTLSQQQVDFINPANPSNTETRNAPEKRKIKGVEVDLTVAPVAGLLLGANYVYTDAPTTPVTNPFTLAIQDVSSAFTAKHAVTLSADYTFPRFSFGELRVHFDGNSAGNYISNNTVPYKSDSAFLINGRLTLGDIDVGGGTFDIALWGKNLTNANYNYFDWRQPGTSTSTRYNDPRTYGIEARARF
jgi:iron complex outermembrane receptor protein